MTMDEWDIKLVVLGEPMSQARPKFQSRDRNGKPLDFVRTRDPSANAKRDFLAMVQEKAPTKPLLGPLRVDCYFYYAHLSGHYRTGKYAGILKESAPVWKDTGKDRDNCDKFVLDALEGVFFRNDSQVCDGRIMKKYSENPRTEVYIKKL